MGLSQKELGESLGYGATMISAFETGGRRMKVEDLTRVCIVLNKPPEYFFAPQSVQRHEGVGLSLRAELAALPEQQLATSIGSFLDELEVDMPIGDPVPDLRDLRPEAAAREVLEIAEISTPPVAMERVCEALGIPLYRRRMPESLSAVVLSVGEDAFVVAVNKWHAQTRRRFSIAHEVGHAVLRHDASYYLEYAVDDAWEPPGFRYLDEREANAFAAALLMDERQVREDFAGGLRDLPSLARRYEVSQAAMGFRLMNLGLS
jgi:Zn-dependent peptidase ImmA (M78 family)